MPSARPLHARLLCALLGALAAAVMLAGSAAAATLGDWSRADQSTVVRARLLSAGRTGFGGERRLEARDLASALSRLTGRPVRLAPGAVTMARLDRAVVDSLGLGRTARIVQAGARRAGLRPPRHFGGEVVARALRLRFDHPDDRLETFPTDPATRAEGAYSLARALELRGSGLLGYVRSTYGRFALARYSGAQRRVLATAVSRIGFPYISGGSGDGTVNARGGRQAHGGFNCSGLILRAFRGVAAGARIRGGYSVQMAAETGRRERVRLSGLRGGDLMFFGWNGQIDHSAIALSRDWLIQSADQGVTVSPTHEPWVAQQFAFGRRLL